MKKAITIRGKLPQQLPSDRDTTPTFPTIPSVAPLLLPSFASPLVDNGGDLEWQDDNAALQQALAVSRKEFEEQTAAQLHQVEGQAVASSSSLAHIPSSHAAKVKANPKITTQMNADWMRKYEDRTKKPAAKYHQGRSQLDSELVRKFRIVWWYLVCTICEHLY